MRRKYRVLYAYVYMIDPQNTRECVRKYVCVRMNERCEFLCENKKDLSV